MRDPDFDPIVDDALRTLPAPKAPASLLPRIMAAVERHAARAWYLRGWRAWPLGWQVAAAALFVAIAAAFGVFALPVSREVSDIVVTPATETVSRFEQFALIARALANAAITTWRAVAEPLMGYALVLVAAVTTISAALGVAINRVALGGASRS